jgi:hypothetical protein
MLLARKLLRQKCAVCAVEQKAALEAVRFCHSSLMTAAAQECVGVYIVMVCPWTDHILARTPLLEVEVDLS